MPSNWAMERAAALEAALRQVREDLAVLIAPPMTRQDVAIKHIDAALRDHGGALAEHRRRVLLETADRADVMAANAERLGDRLSATEWRNVAAWLRALPEEGSDAS